MNVRASATPVSLGKAIAEARRACDLTQQELCAQTGIAYSTLTKIERGAIKKPNVFTVLQIAQATNLKVEQLLASAAARPAENPYTAAALDYPPAEAKRTSKSGIKFVYFDLHGVLINASRSDLALLATISGRPLAEVEELFWRHNADLCLGKLSMAEFNLILGKELAIPQLEWHDIYLRAVRTDGQVRAALEWIRRDYPVGLLTNVFPGNVTALIEKGLIPQHYAAIVDSSVVGLIKPFAAIYEYACKQAAVRPEEILLIDDRQLNISGARACGWQGFWLSPQSRPNLEARLRELLEF